jgi:hypothetical protein
MRTAFMGAVYRKVTRVSIQTAASTGHILTLVSTDAERFVEVGVVSCCWKVVADTLEPALATAHPFFYGSLPPLAVFHVCSSGPTADYYIGLFSL